MNVLGAITAGYTTRQILNYLSQAFPDLGPRISDAIRAKKKPEDILMYLSSMDPKILSRLKGKSSPIKPFEDEISDNPHIASSQLTKQHDPIPQSIKTGAKIGATALGGYALSRIIPRAGQSILPTEIFQTEDKQSPIEAETIDITPEGLPNYQKSLPNKQPQIEYDQPIQKEAPAVAPQESSTIVNNPEINKVKPSISINSNDIIQRNGIAAFLDRSIQGGLPINDIVGAIKKLYPQQAKSIEKEAKTTLDKVIEQYRPESERPTPQSIQPLGQPSPINPPSHKVLPEEPEEKAPTQSISATAIQEPKQKHIDTGSAVALSSGEIGNIESVKNGIAKIKMDDGQTKIRKIDDLIESPLPEKDLAELFEDLKKGIEKKSGQEISRNVYWAGYDPKTNELAYLPHNGSFYIYDNISPSDASQLTNILNKRKSTGENFMGAWEKGTDSPIGAAMSALIKKLQKERNGKGNEYTNKFEKIYDALELATTAAKKKHAEDKKKAKKPRVN
jgi:hypothetical protein